MQMRGGIIAAAVAAVAQIWTVSSTLATPVTYDLSATLDGGGTVTGNFTVDAGSLIAFDFVLPTTLPDPPVSDQIDLANSYPSESFISVAALPQTRIGSYYDDAGTWYDTVLNLQLDSLPVGSGSASLGFSSLLQAPLFGSNWDYVSFFQSGTIQLDDDPPSGRPPAIRGRPRCAWLDVQARKHRAATAAA